MQVTIEVAVSENNQDGPGARRVADDGQCVDPGSPIRIDLNSVDIIQCFVRPVEFDVDRIGVALRAGQVLGSLGRPLLIGYARVSTEEQDLTAQRQGLAALGVDVERIYVDHGLTGTNRERPGLREALAACRAGDTLVVTKLDRLPRSLPDARAIAEDLTKRKVRLSLGASVYDPTDPVGRLLFNVLTMVAEFEGDLIRSRTREGMRAAKAKGHLRGKQPKLNPRQEAHLVELLNTGEYTTSEVGDLFGVARSTVYRAVARSKHSITSAAVRTSQKPRVETPPAASAQVPTLYRPRHGGPSDLPSENRTRRNPRKPRPEQAPQTGH